MAAIILSYSIPSAGIGAACSDRATDPDFQPTTARNE